MLKELVKNWKVQAVHGSLTASGCVGGITLTQLHSDWAIVAIGALALSAAAAIGGLKLPRKVNYGYAVAASSGAAGGAAAVLLLTLGSLTLALLAAVGIPVLSSGIIVEYRREHLDE